MFAFIKNLFESKNNIVDAVLKLLNLLQVKVTRTSLAKQLQQHPDYPSFLSVSDVLNNLNVKNITASFNADSFSTLPTPFITPLKSKKQSFDLFAVVINLNDRFVRFFDPETHSTMTASLDDFLTRWRGIVFLAEVMSVSGEKEYAKNVRKEKRDKIFKLLITLIIPVLVVATGVLNLMQTGMQALLPFIFMLLTLAGSIVGILLLWYEIDQHNPGLRQICSTGRKTNCSAILHSNVSHIWGISWSAIGFTYFTGVLLLILFKGITNKDTLFIASWLNTCALPYVFFSIFYQWRVARQWCVLCLCVQALLVLQSIVALTGRWHSLSSLQAIFPVTIVPIALALVIPFITTWLLIPALQQAIENKQHFTQLQRLKHNTLIFDALLARQKKITESTDGLGIIIGNPNGSVKIVKVCNPYCPPCAKAHPTIDELIHNNTDVQVQIIFTATNGEADKRTAPVKHLLAIAEKNDSQLTSDALDDWYLAETKDYAAFAAKYPMNGELQTQGIKVKAMEQWCKATNITFTPTFFVNGYQLPEIYSVSDVKYFFSV